MSDDIEVDEILDHLAFLIYKVDDAQTSLSIRDAKVELSDYWINHRDRIKFLVLTNIPNPDSPDVFYFGSMRSDPDDQSDLPPIIIPPYDG